MSMILYDFSDMEYYCDRALCELKIPPHKYEEYKPGQGLRVNRNGEFVRNGRLSKKQEIETVIQQEYESEEKVKKIIFSYDSSEQYMKLEVYGIDGKKILIRDGWKDDHHDAVRNFFYRL